MQEHIIQKLPEELINQIKAGEVVERPASVVKELVENSIDAKANAITVELLDGGKQLIRIIDNGIGISAADLPTALERHATSKIKNFSDLEKISSFGFRGEALPSVASVSEFTIKSKPKDQLLGKELSVSKGKIISEKDVSLTQGTVIQVKDLFCNVPARLKFLKSTSTEYSHIHDFLLSISFFYHHLSFHLKHNGRDVFHYKQKDSSLKRFEEIVGIEARDYAPIFFERGSFQISGFSLLPEKATSLPQYFVTFVNGRLVKDKIIRAGVLQGYQGLLLKGLLPSSVIFINVDPTWIDVNVHPAKTEVRFTDPLAVQELIAIGIQNSLKTEINKKLKHEAKPIIQTNEQSIYKNTNTQTNNINFAQKNTYSNKDNSTTIYSKHENNDNIRQRFHLTNLKTNLQSFSNKETENTFIQQPNSVATNQTNNFNTNKQGSDNAQKLFQEPAKSSFTQAKYLGQYSNCYLILEKETELWIIDQHAFHERILFEEYTTEYSKHPIPKQSLLTPFIVSSTHSISLIAEEHKDKINSLGFEIEILSNSNIALHTFPAFLPPQKISQTFDEILGKLLAINGVTQGEIHPIFEKAQFFSLQQEIMSVKNTELNQTQFYHLFYATLACHNAVRAGDPLNAELVQRLLDRSNQVDFFAHCPHGRPVIRKFEKKDVEAWFLRI